jgi:hypothetical protein
MDAPVMVQVTVAPWLTRRGHLRRAAVALTEWVREEGARPDDLHSVAYHMRTGEHVPDTPMAVRAALPPDVLEYLEQVARRHDVALPRLAGLAMGIAVHSYWQGRERPPGTPVLAHFLSVRGGDAQEVNDA